MTARKPKFNVEYLSVIFIFSILGLEYFVIFLLPHLTELSVNNWSQYLAYAAGILFGLGFLGDKRLTGADRFLSRNAKKISHVFTDFVLIFFLFREEKIGDRREVGLWYLFSLLDLIMWVVLLKVTFPGIGVDMSLLGAFLKQFMWIELAIVVLVLTLLPWALLPISRLIDRFLTRVIRYQVRSIGFMLNLWFLPTSLLFAWITIPWLFFVFVTWIFFQVLLSIVRLKNRLKLGNVFYVFGFILLIGSFGFFLFA